MMASLSNENGKILPYVSLLVPIAVQAARVKMPCPIDGPMQPIAMVMLAIASLMLWGMVSSVDACVLISTATINVNKTGASIMD